MLGDLLRKKSPLCPPPHPATRARQAGTFGWLWRGIGHAHGARRSRRTIMAASPLLDANSAPKDDDVPRVLIACSNVSHSVQVRVGCCKAQPRQILTSVSCAFQPGSLTALMGPSGAGKTTLLSLLRSGRPSSGEVTLNGQPHGRHAG